MSFPTFHLMLKVIGAGYLLFLAWRIATSSAMEDEGGMSNYRPMTFLSAAAFQWVNIKAWFMAVMAMTIYTNHQHGPDPSIILVAATFATINFPCVSVWAVFGQMIRRFFTNKKFVKYFNIVSALLLVFSLWPILS